MSQDEEDRQDRFENTFLWVAGVSFLIAFLVLAMVWGCAKRDQSLFEAPVTYSTASA